MSNVVVDFTTELGIGTVIQLLYPIESQTGMQFAFQYLRRVNGFLYYNINNLIYIYVTVYHIEHLIIVSILSTFNFSTRYAGWAHQSTDASCMTNS